MEEDAKATNGEAETRAKKEEDAKATEGEARHRTEAKGDGKAKTRERMTKHQDKATNGEGENKTKTKAKKEEDANTPALNKLINPEKRSKKCILRFFICHLDKHFLTFWANSVGNPQRKQLFSV